MFKISSAAFVLLIVMTCCHSSWAWHDETHVAIAKAAGYAKWFNATGADMIKVKARSIEKRNHYVNNPRGTTVTPTQIYAQVVKYNGTDDPVGHLYGAIIASIRDYVRITKTGKYAEYHLAFAAHYIGDLSQPLHNTLYNDFNRTNHGKFDGMINKDVLENVDRITVYDIHIASEEDLVREIARIANLSMAIGYMLEDEKRMLTKQEAYAQVSHSVSLFKAVLKYVRRLN